MTRQSGRDVPSATSVSTDGPLGATNVQSALDLIAAAGPFFTTESIASFAISGTYTTVLTLPIATGSTRHFFGLVHVAGGTPVTPTTQTEVVVVNATRTSGGTVDVTGVASLDSGDLTGWNLRVQPSGANVVVQIRSSTAQNVRVLIQYLWLELLPV